MTAKSKKMIEDDARLSAMVQLSSNFGFGKLNKKKKIIINSN